MKKQIKTIMLLIAGLSTISSMQARTPSAPQDELQTSVDSLGYYDALYAEDTVIVLPASQAQSAAAQPAGKPAKASSPKSYCPHEIGIWLSGGLSELLYTSSFGERKPGFGGSVGLGYTWYFHRNWGIGLGAEFALYQGKINIDGLTDAYDTQDADGKDIIYNARINSYKERQYLGNVNIPLQFIFQTKTRGEHKYYAALAFKLGVPVYDSYNSKSATFTTSGYYPEWNQLLTEQQDLGYGTFTGINSKGKIPFSLSYIGNFETGFKWHVSAGRYLYTGIYAEYAFNDVVKGEPSDRFVSYNNLEPEKFETNGVLTSEYRRYGTSKSFTDRVHLLGVGFKLKLGLSAGCSAQLDAERAAKEAKKSAEKQAKKDEKRQERMEDLQYLQAQQQALGNGGGGRSSGSDADAARYYADAARYMADAAKASAEQAKVEADRAREERDAYLRDARRRRAAFERDIVRPNENGSLRDVDNYNLSVVTLNAVQKRDLDDYIEVLKSDEHMTARITGHTCDIGSDELNLRIGQERADLAKDYMVENGIAPKRISTFSRGEASPAYPNNNAVNRKKNRRLGIEIVR